MTSDLLERRKAPRRKTHTHGHRRFSPGRRAFDIAQFVKSTAQSLRPLLTDPHYIHPQTPARTLQAKPWGKNFAIKVAYLLLAVILWASLPGRHAWIQRFSRHVPMESFLRTAVPLDRAIYRWSGFHRVGFTEETLHNSAVA